MSESNAPNDRSVQSFNADRRRNAVANNLEEAGRRVRNGESISMEQAVQLHRQLTDLLSPWQVECHVNLTVTLVYDCSTGKVEQSNVKVSSDEGEDVVLTALALVGAGARCAREMIEAGGWMPLDALHIDDLHVPEV